MFCDCSSWSLVEKQGENLFSWDPTYGWVLGWIMLTEEKGYTQVHRYGVPVLYCPFCGKKLATP